MDDNKRSSLKKLKWFPERPIPRRPLHKLHHYTFNVVQGYDEWSEQWGSDLTGVVSVLFSRVLKLRSCPFSFPYFSHLTSSCMQWFLLATLCWEPLAQGDQFYQYQKVCVIVVVSLRQSQLMTVNSPKDFPFISLTSLQFLVLRARVNTVAILSFIKN